MEFKGTKGEWSVSESGNPTFNKCVVGEDGGSVCFVTNWSDSEENAKLIASAPELLEALVQLKASYEELVDSGDCGSWNPRTDECIVDAKKAIEKAL